MGPLNNLNLTKIFNIISFPEGDQSNEETNLPNAGKKFHEATKTVMRRRSRYEKQINVSSHNSIGPK